MNDACASLHIFEREGFERVQRFLEMGSSDAGLGTAREVGRCAHLSGYDVADLVIATLQNVENAFKQCKALLPRRLREGWKSGFCSSDRCLGVRCRSHCNGREWLFGCRIDDAHFESAKRIDPRPADIEFARVSYHLFQRPSASGRICRRCSLDRIGTKSCPARLTKARSTARFHSDAARQVLAITGFDRVMIYEFDSEGHGAVTAEAIRGGMESFLGLRYPPSDIPSQARSLYLRNPSRIIANGGSTPVQLLPPVDAITKLLDLSMAISRSVSPVHIEYLKNMGVGASLCISIVVEEKLWGLIACHFRDPRLPSFIMRTAAELFGSMYSMMLESRLRRGAGEDEQKARSLADRLIVMIAGDETLLENAGWLQDMTRDMIDCDGVATYRAEHVYLHGSTPPEEQVIALAHHLNAASPSRVYTTDNLAAVHAPCAQTSHLAAGMLAIPISRVPRDYIMLFRRERLTEIKWGGDPAKMVEQSEDGLRLTPRKSFAAFSELVRGRATPFSEREERIGEAILQALIEVILRFANDATEERRRSTERQEMLIAELNHRVRNILALIRSLVTKTSPASTDVSSYVVSLGGRVQALARAHDRVPKQNWGPTDLAGLFEDEIAAHDATI